MKKYKGYMDSVKASDTLHQRLTELDAPKARPAVWKRYGAVAAALVSLNIAYYAMWILAVVVFALAVYYTVKQL